MSKLKILSFPLVILAIALTSSCSPVKNVSYFQDIQSGVSNEIITPLEIRVQPGDKISIVVNSKDAELTNLFNLPITSQRIGMTASGAVSYSSQQISGYTVSQTGEIDFPVVGRVGVAGLTRAEIAAHIKYTLIIEDLVKDPVVTVEFMNLGFSVLGEVSRPGRFAFDRDKTTLLDAIAMAGDLTIYGKREAVVVIRDENGFQVPYKVDITSAEELFKSPVFYLQQNDVVYIEPNDVRARHSTVNGNNIRSTSFWMSLTSLLVTVAVLFKK